MVRAGDDAYGYGLSERILPFLYEHAFEFRPTEPVTLSSGDLSPFYFNLLDLEGSPRGSFYAAAALAETVERYTPEEYVVAGEALGGVPFAKLTGFLTGNPVALNRKERKQHGNEEGTLVGANVHGRRVAPVDDVVTGGGSMVGLVEEILEQGGEVYDAFALIDRCQDGRRRIEREAGGPENDISLRSIVSMEEDFLPYLRTRSRDADADIGLADVQIMEESLGGDGWIETAEDVYETSIQPV